VRDECEYCDCSEVAAVCGVDVKTVHNWCKLKDMPHIRTPGRRLRFKLPEVVPWLAKYGYTIPAKWSKHLPKAAAATA
jgi:excisionase family DNA binding protein